ncbi:MAG TPA: hypothetical protein VLM76_11660 [Patescibacteria group bacterium]|nr:hypothetical protein [Patescibacteria group bacterium]
MTARLLDSLCRRYGQLPSAMLAEDAYLMLRLNAVLAEATDE